MLVEKTPLRQEERTRQVKRNYYQRNIEKIRKYNTKFYNDNKDRIRTRRRELYPKYYLMHKDKIKATKRIETNDRRTKHINSWIDSGLFPSMSVCQCCGVNLYFSASPLSQRIHFDHRSEGIEKINEPPKRWLGHHPATPENIELWKSCNFGILCKYCNKFLPSMNRKKFLENAIKYVFGDTAKISVS